MPQSQAHKDSELKRLGQEILIMMGELRARMGNDVHGYCRRKLSYPGGVVHMILCTDSEVADIMDEAAAAKYSIQHGEVESQQ